MRKILLQILVFTFFFMGIFNVARIFMQNAFVPLAVFDNNFIDILKMYFWGIVSDFRVLSIAFLPLLFCGFLSYLKPLIAKLWGGGCENLIQKIYLYFSSFYIAILSFICVIFSFISFYYFQMFKNRIDIFIFGLKDDNTSTLLTIIYNDYPVFSIVVYAILILVFCVWLNTRILGVKFKVFKPKFVVLIFLNLLLIYLYVIALRGGTFKHIGMRDSNYKFSEISTLNEISVNPILSFSWAYKHYKNRANLPIISKKQALKLEEKLFPLYATSPRNDKALRESPHVVVNFMESFGLNMLDYDSKELDLLGELREHFESDFLFKRFLSASNATMSSFAKVFYLSPFSAIAQSKYQKTYLKDTPFEVYKKAGYKVIFIYGGNASWENIGNYLLNLGVDEVYDEISLIKEYPQAKATQNGYGIADEFAYQKIYSLLENSKEKLFIVHLSISNHAPYTPPTLYLTPEQMTKDFLDKLHSSRESNSQKIIQAYAYANNEFGKFLSKVKDSNFKDKIIIAATADHRQRELDIDILSQKAFAYSVPFYLYVPKNLQNNIHYDETRIGSHKDIFPTLYELSLSQVTYLNLGGKNMLTKPRDERLEFGINEKVFIDKYGIYPIDSKGYFYENNENLKDTNQAFEIDEAHKSFMKDYETLSYYQLALRLNLID